MQRYRESILHAGISSALLIAFPDACSQKSFLDRVRKCKRHEARQVTRTRDLASKRQVLEKKVRQFLRVQDVVKVHMMMPRICASSTERSEEASANEKVNDVTT